ncbi:hypothetical protein [Bdellovibrio sp. HCB-110]|uniref:hypothetical protein n=1 Tax=Bdellovibrio sp. HCB-110 TaxID=3391182 RepID=UPI0039B620C4
MKYIVAFGVLSLLILTGIAGFNYSVDPMCYYHCSEVDLSKRTQNVYYQTAQTAVANADAEILILGSSRGETTPPVWIQEVTGKKTINLSQAGGDLLLKIAVLNSALDKGAKVKTVIWLADYFELVRSSTDIKVRITPALQKHLLREGKENVLSFYLDHLQRLIDHNSTEASLEHLKDRQDSYFPKLGTGGSIDYKSCLSPDYTSDTATDVLEKKILSSYGNFSTRMASEQDEDYWRIFENQIRILDRQGIKVLILVPPVHSDFRAKLYKEFPGSKEKTQKWLERMEKLSTDNIRVKSFLDGIPSDDQSPSFWTDGVHMTCKSMMLMLQGTLGDL